MAEGDVPCSEYYLVYGHPLACVVGRMPGAAVNTAWRSVKREVCRAVCNGLGSVIGHWEICANRPELFGTMECTSQIEVWRYF